MTQLKEDVQYFAEHFMADTRLTTILNYSVRYSTTKMANLYTNVLFKSLT